MNATVPDRKIKIGDAWRVLMSFDDAHRVNFVVRYDLALPTTLISTFVTARRVLVSDGIQHED